MKPRYDEEKNESRHAAVDADRCEQMAYKYSWKLKRVELTGNQILEVDCVFEGETEFPNWQNQQEREDENA